MTDDKIAALERVRSRIIDIAPRVLVDPKDLRALLAHIADLTARAERAEALVYVPGHWRCPKCSFYLVQASLNARDGTVSAQDKPGEPCPNCRTPLWRVTEREAGNTMVDRCEEQMARASAAEKRADALAAEVARLRGGRGQTTGEDHGPEWLYDEPEEECPNCGGEGRVEDCFEDTCVCLNPPCCWRQCDWCGGEG